jgi:hypothetical protein
LVLEETLNKIEKMPEGAVFILEVDAADYVQLIAEILASMKKTEVKSVYITVNKPYSFLKELFDKAGVDILKLYFIDAISRVVGETSTRKENVIFPESPSDLTGINIAIEQTVNTLHKKHSKPLIIFDSISTLTIYYPIETIQKFVHILTGKTKLRGFRDILISVPKAADEKMSAMIKQFCDAVINVE